MVLLRVHCGRSKLPTNRSAELQFCANPKRAKLELRAPITRFLTSMRVQHWRSELPMNRRIQHRVWKDTAT